MTESVAAKLQYSSSIETKYTLQKHENGLKLLPVVGVSQPGERFENMHFNLEKSKLCSLKNKDGTALYSQWLIDLVWPEYKSSNEGFLRFDKRKYKDFGINFRNYNRRSHEDLASEAIEDLFLKIRDRKLLAVDNSRTGVVLCSSSGFIDRKSQGTTRTDYLGRNTVLNNIATSLELSPLFCINEACSGFLASIMQAQLFLENQDDLDSIVIVTSEKLSNLLDFNDASSSIIFGDLTTATLVTKSNVEGLRLLGGARCYYPCYIDENKHMVSMIEGEKPIIHVDNGSKTGGRPAIRMNGGATYYHALREIPKAILLLAKHLGVEDMRQILCHQANQKILLELDDAIKKNYPFSKVLVPVSMDSGNVSSSSIPNLMNSMLNRPDDIIDKLVEINGDQQSIDSIQWDSGMTICMASIGMGIYIRSLMFVYE